MADNRQPASLDKHASLVRWSLPLILLFGVVLRVPRLLESLWYDEIFAYLDYVRHGTQHIVTTWSDPANHVLHTLLSWASLEIFETLIGDALALRLPSFVASVIAIVVIASMLHRRGNKVLGALGGLCMAAAPVAVLAGTEARGYAIMMVTCAAMAWLMTSMLDTDRDAPVRTRLSQGAAYAVIAAAGVWAHPVTVVMPLSHGLMVAWRSRRPATRTSAFVAGGALLASAALTIAAYAPLLDDINTRRGLLGARDDTPGLFGIEGIHALFAGGGSFVWWAAAPGLIVALFGLWTMLRAPAHRMLVGSLGLCVPLFLAVILIADTWVYARFFAFMMPLTCVLIAFGVQACWRFHRALASAAMFAVLVGWMADLATCPSRQPLREAAALVDATQTTRPVVVVGLAHSVMDVYAGGLKLEHALHHGDGIDASTTLEAQLARHQPEWVIMLYPGSVDDAHKQLLGDHGFTVEQALDGWLDWGNGRIEIWGR